MSKRGDQASGTTENNQVQSQDQKSTSDTSLQTKSISPQAKRALAEAEARRKLYETEREREIDGRGGLDPARYGDWEVNGISSDF